MYSDRLESSASVRLSHGGGRQARCGLTKKGVGSGAVVAVGGPLAVGVGGRLLLGGSRTLMVGICGLTKKGGGSGVVVVVRFGPLFGLVL